MRKIVIPVAALLVLVAGGVAWANSGRRGTEQAGSVGRFGVLNEVLGDLVEDGTITQHQSDVIVVALDEAKSEALEAMRELRAQLDSYWEDGVLTSEEIAELPFADRIADRDGPLADALADGQITKEELREFARPRYRHMGRTGPWHRGEQGGHWHQGSSGFKGFPDKTGGSSG